MLCPCNTFSLVPEISHYVCIIHSCCSLIGNRVPSPVLGPLPDISSSLNKPLRQYCHHPYHFTAGGAS